LSIEAAQNALNPPGSVEFDIAQESKSKLFNKVADLDQLFQKQQRDGLLLYSSFKIYFSNT
jgi:hypothetical protein